MKLTLFVAGFWAVLMCLPACQSTPKPQQSPREQAAKETPPKPAPKAITQGAKPEYPAVTSSRFAAGERLVAIGDLHGDLAATRDVLRLVGAIGQDDAWVGGKLTLVQTGDQLDRGDDERAILDLLARLQGQAEAAGGAVVVLNGNHETMNASGDFRYVTPGARGTFQGADTRPLPKELLAQLPDGVQDRAAALLPGGSYARMFAKRPVIAVVGDSVFAHGGVHLEHVQYGIDRINQEVSRWLSGQAAAPKLVQQETGPVWSRRFSVPSPTASACAELGQVLTALGVKRLVVGHTVQKGGITSACDERVWRIDVGMSAHYGGSQVMALEVKDTGVTVLKGLKSAQ